MQHFQLTTGTPVIPVPFRVARARDWQSDLVLHMVGKAYKIRRRLLLHPSRSTAGAARARQMAMYLMHVVLGRAMSDVGVVFHRDRTTVSYACAKVEDLRDDPAFDAQLDRFEQRILDLIAGEENDHVAC